VAIEGPLRELSLSDVFQLLDLSRKTGVLTISNEARARCPAARSAWATCCSAPAR
jgi:hypothetical protein